MQRAIEIDPAHAAANTWLGHVPYKGEWMKPEERERRMRADEEAEMLARVGEGLTRGRGWFDTTLQGAGGAGAARRPAGADLPFRARRGLPGHDRPLRVVDEDRATRLGPGRARDARLLMVGSLRALVGAALAAATSATTARIGGLPPSKPVPRWRWRAGKGHPRSPRYSGRCGGGIRRPRERRPGRHRPAPDRSRARRDRTRWPI